MIHVMQFSTTTTTNVVSKNLGSPNKQRCIHTFLSKSSVMSDDLTKLSKGNLVLIQSIARETKHLNDFDFLQITIK